MFNVPSPNIRNIFVVVISHSNSDRKILSWWVRCWKCERKKPAMEAMELLEGGFSAAWIHPHAKSFHLFCDAGPGFESAVEVKHGWHGSLGHRVPRYRPICKPLGPHCAKWVARGSGYSKGNASFPHCLLNWLNAAAGIQARRWHSWVPVAPCLAGVHEQFFQGALSSSWKLLAAAA